MKKTAVIILADGFEEIEAIATADVLMRLGIKVILAGMVSRKVTGTHSIVIEAEMLLADISPASVDAVVLPGGIPGATNLRDCYAVINFVKSVYADGKIAAAICAAPVVLAKAGVLDGKRATCYPSFEAQFAPSTQYTGNRIEADGRVITGKGAGVSFEFGAMIGAALGVEKDAVEKALDAMFVKI